MTNRPIVAVQKEMIYQHTEHGNGASLKQYNAGPGQQRIKVLAFQRKSDVGNGVQEWTSSNNGQTWSEVTMLDPLIPPGSPGTSEWTEGFTNAIMAYDPSSRALIRPYFIDDQGSTDHSFTFYSLSFDHGQTWTPPKQLKYEDGPDFDPSNPLDPNWLAKNNCQRPKNVTLTSAGTVVMAAGYAEDPADPTASNPRLAALNFVGTWNPVARDYDWVVGDRVVVSSQLTSRGLLEAVSAELMPNGTPNDPPRILNIWRGSNTSTTPGRKWYSVSDDGGLTLSPVAELKYDDGTSFYSPSSMSELFRAQSNGKLYWIGNISPTAPSGNLPRHPLVIAEVDENLVALKKDTVTVIADRTAEQLDSVRYSNFSVTENRVTNQIEVYVSDAGALSSSSNPNVYPNVFDYDAYKYTLTLPIPGDATADGQVDEADAAVLAEHWLQTTAAGAETGDFNGDGIVDDLDASILAAHWTGSAADASVPEPSSLALLVGAMGLLHLVRRECRMERSSAICIGPLN
ncbi:MAG: PEP-CTERM sorting domain-containing protein [Pirellulales bacterium]|nr:PEP-CTERM sorting domain-containing protein [Pirellulales bacterium]